MRMLKERLGLLTVLTLLNWGTTVLQSQQAQAEETKPIVAIRCGPSQSVILNQVKPIYPSEAREKHIQGLVRIRAVINSQGIPDRLQVLKGPPELIPASLEAVKQWRYKPYELNGKAVSVETSIEIKFVLPVPDAPTAVNTAEKALSKIYGKDKIEAEKPFNATLSDGVWHVVGTLYCYDEKGNVITNACVGGVAMADIRQSDGRVLRTGHGK